MKRSFPEVAQTICLKFPNAPYFGVFYGTEPTLMVQDPEIIKSIMTKDFYYFSGREISAYTHKEVLTQNLFFTYGDRWKVLRQNLTPLFSSTKMKNMFHLIEKCSNNFEYMLDKEFSNNNIVEIRKLFSRFTMDAIGSCAFGINTKTMENGYENNIFTKMGNAIFMETYYRGFKVFARAVWPAIFYGLGMKSFPTEIDRFFHNLITEVLKGRHYKPSGRNDFVDLILKFKESKFITGDKLSNMKDDNKKISLEVDDELLVAQCVTFFGAGYETSSTILQYLSYELAKHPAQQNRLIEEVDQYLKRHNNKLVYECVTELPYVEACINEAMRLYPVLGVITRELIEQYTLPCGAVLDKGVRIHIPVHHLHHNPDNFPEPEEFRPERFYGDEKQYVKPYTYLPFGEGPRICIGMRFAKMQMMAGIITFYKKYRVELAEGTPRKLQFGVTTIVTQPVKQIKLKLIKRHGLEERTTSAEPFGNYRLVDITLHSPICTMIALVLIILFTICFIIYHVSKREFDYWKKRRIPYTKPLPFVGNYGEYISLRKFMGQAAQEICQKFPKAPYVGAFYGCVPTLMLQDPDIIKQVMAKDFYYFNSREISDYTYKELITTNLFFSHGDRWKLLRQSFTPLFSSSKLKNMFYLIEKCAHGLENMLDYEYSHNDIIKVRSLTSRYTMDCIGECIFGVDTKTMEKSYENNPFTIMGELIFKDSKYRGFKQIARSVWPSVFYGIGLRNFPEDIVTFFHKLLTNVFVGRQYKPTSRNDFIDLILSLKQKNYIIGEGLGNSHKGEEKKASIKVNDEFLVSQSIGIFAAGYETSATTLHYVLYELAKHKEIQDRAIQEVDEYLHRNNNKICFDCTTDMPFLEACIDEILRLYPVLSVLTREVVEKYTLPCGAVLDKGVRVHIPVYHLHHHPAYFEDPEEFRPDRFLGDAKRDIKPYIYLPFGEGPRICLGMRFSRMQIVPCLITILKKYQVELTEDTPIKLEFGSTTLVTQPTKEIKLRLIQREGWEDRQLVYADETKTN
ncbi:uncharacterized protein ACR2FA_006460 [Aphomia sociella]